MSKMCNDRYPHLRTTDGIRALAIAFIAFFAIQSTCVIASPAASMENAYIEARDAAIKRLDAAVASATEEAATKAEEAARTELEMRMFAILGPLAYDGFGPGRLNLDTLMAGDQGFAMLDGLRFDAKIGVDGEAVGSRRPDGSFVEPKAHIIVTTETLLARWWAARATPGARNKAMPPVGSTLADASLYTRAISTDAAVFKFASLAVDAPRSASVAVAMLAGRSQSEMPDSADEIFAATIVDGRVFVAYGAIETDVRAPSCLPGRFDYVKRLERPNVDADKIRRAGEKALESCFAREAPKEPAFVKASKQAQTMLDFAVRR